MQHPALDQRGALAQQWLYSLGYPYQLQSLIADASFRRYWRLSSTENHGSIEAIGAPNEHSFLLMDCPPNKESLAAFIQATRILAQNSRWKVPTIFAQDDELGFALIENFGDTLLSKAYENNPQDSSAQYIAFALDALLGIQVSTNPLLNDYDATQLQAEMDLFDEWFVEKLCDYHLRAQEKIMLLQVKEQLIENMLAQAQVIVHRDYHCRNLILSPHLDGKPNNSKEEMPLLLDNHALGVIDFQDAVNGAITYDIVSLIKDCYWQLSEEKQYALLKQHWTKLKAQRSNVVDWQNFQRDFDYSGIQRHLKVLGIFSRLALAYDKPHYLKSLDLVVWHITTALARYPQFAALNTLIKQLATQQKIPQIK